MGLFPKLNLFRELSAVSSRRCGGGRGKGKTVRIMTNNVIMNQVPLMPPPLVGPDVSGLGIPPDWKCRPQSRKRGIPAIILIAPWQQLIALGARVYQGYLAVLDKASDMVEKVMRSRRTLTRMEPSWQTSHTRRQSSPAETRPTSPPLLPLPQRARMRRRPGSVMRVMTASRSVSHHQ